MHSGVLEMKVNTFNAGDLVSITDRYTGEKTIGIVIHNTRMSMYDPDSPGRSFYTYSVMVEGKVQNVCEDSMRVKE